jgi:hypothetical protein
MHTGATPEGCERTLYSWAPGSEFFALPKKLHMRLGKDTPFKAVAVQMHYNNVDGVTNETDSSAFEVYHTTKPREIPCGYPSCEIAGPPVL